MNNTILITILILFLSCSNSESNKVNFFFKEIDDGISTSAEVYINKKKLDGIDKITYDKINSHYKISVFVSDTFSLTTNDTIKIINILTMGARDNLYSLNYNSNNDYYLNKICVKDPVEKKIMDENDVKKMNEVLSNIMELHDLLWSE